ncbi:MAG: Ldh family oxidoreductase [Pseudomonadota bacterium]
MSDVTLTLDEVWSLAEAAFLKNGCDAANAEALTRTVWRAERDGAKSHGLFRVPALIKAIASGKANGKAAPKITDRKGVVIGIDADQGYAPTSHMIGLPALAEVAKSQGMGALAIRDCFHFAALWPEVETLTDQGLVGMAMTASPPYMATAGGKRRVFGTNPLAFGWPRADAPPVVFDMATAHSARGEVMIAARDGHQAHEGAGIDKDGNPTTDPNAILEGAQLPFGGYKGAALALMVDLMAGPLIGEKTSLDIGRADDGVGPALGGQTIIAMDPSFFGSSDAIAHGEKLFSELKEEPDVRLPGDRRAAERPKTPETGVVIPASLHDSISALT